MKDSKVIQGGSWYSRVVSPQTGLRSRVHPGYCRGDLGFRLVLEEESGIKVLLGGSWLDTPNNVRKGFRLHSRPGPRHVALGFRLLEEDS